MKTYAVVGLGYVGLGLALALGQLHTVFGYDINPQRVRDLNNNLDTNMLFDQGSMQGSHVTYTSDLESIKKANFYIVAVATPAYFYDMPNLKPLIKATKTIASVIKKGDIIVFESTVYPGTTEEICIPILEDVSQLRCGVDFNVGYSPERINPGDLTHTLKTITKIISAQNKKTLDSIKDTYASICDTVYPVSSIPIAEAIKILENTQRDVNIALMNEFTKIMHTLHLNTHEIIEGAKTKFGFVPFRPGFVGGHCISIDPNYLRFVAKRHGFQPELIVAARNVNDGMPQFVIQSMMKILIAHHINLEDISIGVFGISYKEDTVDVRNSLSLKLIKELREEGFLCHVHDPLVGLEPLDELNGLTVAILAVGHEQYRQIGLQRLLKTCKKPMILMDIPNLFIDEYKQVNDLIYWSL